MVFYNPKNTLAFKEDVVYINAAKQVSLSLYIYTYICPQALSF